MIQSICRRTKFLRKSFVDDNNIGVRAHFRVVEFTAVQDASSHGLEIVGKYRDHRRTLFGWAAVESERPSHKTRGVERKEFCFAGATDSGQPPDSIKCFLEVGERVPLDTMSRAVQ